MNTLDCKISRIRKVTDPLNGKDVTIVVTSEGDGYALQEHVPVLPLWDALREGLQVELELVGVRVIDYAVIEEMATPEPRFFQAPYPYRSMTKGDLIFVLNEYGVPYNYEVPQTRLELITQIEDLTKGVDE